MTRSMPMILCLSILVLSLVLPASIGFAQTDDTSPVNLIVFHAGSLSLPFKAISDVFSERYPEVTVLAEAAGSRDTARKVSDLQRECDVLGSADYKVVENLLMPDHTTFNIRFATNEMAIAYTEHSRMVDQINADNWHEILMNDEVVFGRADPDSDPCGYRTVMVFQLAELFYDQPDLANQLQAKHGKRYIRPKETDLLALLEAGEIDYLPIYRSVAIQHGLKFITLPDQINLKSTDYADFYKNAVVKVTGKAPGEYITRTGAPIVYSVTIPENAPNRAYAIAYLELLLSPVGQNIMAEKGQSPIVPAVTLEVDALPEPLKPYCGTP